MNEFENLTNIRPKDETTGFEVDRYEWLWLAADAGAYVGPRTDWEHSHKDKYFKGVRRFEVCVQAGGCLGMYPRMLATRFKHVYTFEPDPLSFFVLVNNLQVDNVSAFNAALGETVSRIRVERVAQDNVGMNKVQHDHQGSRILQLTIDSLNLDACDLILLDIEGSEIHAIRGAVETIRRHRPVIACENANDQIWQVLRVLDYHEGIQSVSDKVFIPK